MRAHSRFHCGRRLPLTARICASFDYTMSGWVFWPRPTSTRSGEEPAEAAARTTSPVRSVAPASCSVGLRSSATTATRSTTGSVSQGRADRAGQYRHDPELRAPLRRALVHPGARRDRGDCGAHPGRDRTSPHALDAHDSAAVDQALWAIAGAINDQIAVLRRIPEKMDPALYYKTFRPYIRFFENVSYEGVEGQLAASA